MKIRVLQEAMLWMLCPEINPQNIRNEMNSTPKEYQIIYYLDNKVVKRSGSHVC
jgi:hypothetical protein